jgi:hypothetical protein
VGDIPAADIAAMLAKGFRATTLEAEVGAPDTIVICVPTPLSADSTPDLAAVSAATKTAGRLLRPGMLVVLESTTYPGTTDEVVRPLLEKVSGLTAGVDFSLAFSPERIDPGNPDVDEIAVRGRQQPVGDLVGDDALADEGPDHLARAAHHYQPPVADRPVRAEHAQRDQHWPGAGRLLRKERRGKQAADGVVLQVMHARARPTDKCCLVMGGQHRVDKFGDNECDEEDPRDGVSVEDCSRSHSAHEARLWTVAIAPTIRLLARLVRALAGQPQGGLLRAAGSRT